MTTDWATGANDSAANPETDLTPAQVQKGTRRKVFGIGLWRTGTTSLTSALRQIGIRCKHYPYDKTTQSELWNEAPSLSLLNRYDAITDISIVPFYKSLDRSYPGSRFILTLRDQEAWLDSMQRQIELIWTSKLIENPQFRAFTEAICMRVYGGIDYDPDRLLKRYRAHIADVDDYFRDRDGDLLRMNIPGGDGWEKLCPFLGLPSPDSDFPRSNVFSKDPYAWDRKIAAFLDTIANLDIETGDLLLLDDARLRAYLPHDEKPVPFPSKNGRYAGRPKDGDHACRFLRDAHEAGAKALIVAWPSFWWYESYPEFLKLLEDRCTILLNSDLVHVYSMAGLSTP